MAAHAPATPVQARPFEVVSDFEPAGDQPKAIAELTDGIEGGERFQTLLGITGSGKSATIAWTIQNVQRPTLVLAPNKSLAAQLANEFKEFFPTTRWSTSSATTTTTNPRPTSPRRTPTSRRTARSTTRSSACATPPRPRCSPGATSSWSPRCSCIYGLGSPEEYRDSLLVLRTGDTHDQRALLRRFVDMQYDRNDMNLVRGTFRVRGDTIEIHPAYDETALRIELFGDEIEQMVTIDPVTGEKVRTHDDFVLLPATHYVAGEERLQRAIVRIEAELQERLAQFEAEGKLLEAQRLRMRTQYDLEMMAEVGFCNGIENYSAPIEGRSAGETPNTLIDYFPKDFLMVLDESHQSVPQLHGQYEGDRSRKENLIEHGFRLPSAADNRPLRFEEFMDRIGQTVFLSATPGPFELERSTRVVEQVVRPTGLIDPEIVVKPTKGQIDDLMTQISDRVARGDRALVTTLTKKMAEDLTDYLLEQGVKVRYLHSEVDTIQRIEILRDLRLGEFDVLVGINLLREGLDLPEVSLVAILDADKEGFLRSETSLIQTIGRAARNVGGQVVMYADKVTPSMQRAISETNRRRGLQQAYNAEHGIDPTTIRKAVTDILALIRPAEEGAPVPGGDRRKERAADKARREELAELPGEELARLISTLEEEMHAASSDLRFEYAARLRDEIKDLRRELKQVG